MPANHPSYTTRSRANRSDRLNHRRLADLLQHQIAEESMVPGDSFYSVREIALRYGVSIGTAHQGVKLLADRQYIETHPRSGTVIGSAVCRAPASSAGIIHMIVGRLSMPAEMMMRMAACNGIIETWPDASVQISLLPEKEEDAKPLLEQLVGKDVARPEILGVLLTCCPREVKQYFFNSGLPVVVHGHLDEDIELPYVDRDQRAIGRMAAKHLTERGHRRIGLLMYDQWRPGDSLMLAGIQEVMGESQLAADDLVIASIPGSEETMVRRAVERMLTVPDRVTAIISRADAMAIECLRVAKKLGLRVPQDVAIFSAGMGDPALSDTDPPITGMAANATEVGHLLGQALMSIRRGESSGRLHVECPVKMVQRKST
jgi:DNA-binding LacI/PurR family transcriptional regulator